MNVIAGMLENLEKVDSDLKFAKPTVVLSHLTVPLIVLKFINGLSVDIQFPRASWQALRNTHLIRNYVSVCFIFYF